MTCKALDIHRVLTVAVPLRVPWRIRSYMNFQLDGPNRLIRKVLFLARPDSQLSRASTYNRMEEN